MRVISGKHKRCELIGYNIDGVRPTMDKVRDSIFAMINPYIDGSMCLDLFSGTGAMGIEALSENARYCYFVDCNKYAIEVTNKNIDKVCEKSKSKVICMDYLKSLQYFSKLGIKYDIIFIDPPYGKIKIKDVIDNILKYDILNDNGVLVCEYEDEDLSDDYMGLSLIKDRRYGRVFIKIYKK